MKKTTKKEKVSFLFRITAVQATKLRAMAEKHAGGNVTRFMRERLGIDTTTT